MTNPTTPQLTESDVKAIEARANAASKGDWTIRGGSWTDGGLKLAGYGVRFAESPFEERYSGWDARTNFPPETPEGAQASADRSFLAHARADIPALIRDWRALKADLRHQCEAKEAYKTVLERRDEENAALREQLAQVTGERDGLKRRIQEMRDERR